MQRERITILTPSFPRYPGGGARVYFEHANRLANRGYDVTVVHPLANRRFPAGLADRARNRLRDLKSRDFFRRRISWMRIDPRIHVRLIDRLDESTTLPDAELRIGTYWETSELLGARPPSESARLQLIQAYEDWAGPKERVDAVWRLPFPAAVVSRSLYAKGVELGVPARRLHLTPNGIDHSVFRVARPVRDRAPCIAFLAHESPVKGLSDAIDTVRLVRSQRPDAEVVAFGSFRRPAALPDDITYLRGLTGDHLVRSVYSRATVFLCTSLSEGFGFPSLEAMACGAALVSTANGGASEFAEPGVSALICPVGDTRELAGSVLTLLNNDDARVEIAANGIRSAARFTWDASGEAFHVAVRAALEEWQASL